MPSMEAVAISGELPNMVASTETHTMGKFLNSYVSQKVHPAVTSRPWKRIEVRGVHRRQPLAQISSTEASGRLFNWQRPTAEVVGIGTIQINCFPGKEYVEHYASLIATYLSLNGQNPNIVHITQPSSLVCASSIFRQSNLADMGQVDTVIIGYVEDLETLSQGPWSNGGGEEQELSGLFSWKKLGRRNDASTALLGCTVSCWGDAAKYLIEALQKINHVQTVLYVTKAGTLCQEYAPNTYLATGNSSWIDGRLVSWENILEPYCQNNSRILKGVNTTVPSVLVETKSWFNEWEHKAQWVDCEVGFMAQASIAGGTAFGYIHIISDNLAREYEHSLSTEDLIEVVFARQPLFRDIEIVLKGFLSQTDLGVDDLWEN